MNTRLSYAAAGLALSLASATFLFASAELPGDLGPNFALGKPYVSSDVNEKGWNSGLTDGVWGSSKGKTFATGGDKRFPKTVTIDLGELRSVAHVLVGVPKMGSTKTIEISTSRDGENFETQGPHDFDMEVENAHLYAFPPTKARYVRLSFLGNYRRASTATFSFPTSWCFVSEVEVFGPRGTGTTASKWLSPRVVEQEAKQEEERKLAETAAALVSEQAQAVTVQLPGGLGPNLALSKPYQCSDPNRSGWDVGLTDGLWLMRKGHCFATGNSKNFPKTVTVNLKTSAKLTHVHVGVPKFGSTRTVRVSLSFDGENFVELGQHVFGQGKGESHLFSFSPTLARHVRLTYVDTHQKKITFDPATCFTTELEVYARPQ